MKDGDTGFCGRGSARRGGLPQPRFNDGWGDLPQGWQHDCRVDACLTTARALEQGERGMARSLEGMVFWLGGVFASARGLKGMP